MAKFDVFNGKIDEPLDSEKKLNTWYDDLLWCPSQCYFTSDGLQVGHFASEGVE